MQTLTFVPPLAPATLTPLPAAAPRPAARRQLTGKVSNSGARPPETRFILSRSRQIRFVVASSRPCSVPRSRLPREISLAGVRPTVRGLGARGKRNGEVSRKKERRVSQAQSGSGQRTRH